MSNENIMHGTTILTVRKDNKVVIASDGQVSRGNTIVKSNVKKVRCISTEGTDEKDKILVGFAGSTADAFALLERLENKLREHPEQTRRACVELAKDWRSDKYLRRLEAIMVVVDKNESLTVSGMGDVMDSDDGIIGIGSGGDYALSAARALAQNTKMSAEKIVKESMKIASDICVFTNNNLTIESIDYK